MSSTTLVGKIAIVTGASAGIGKAIAELLVKNGAIVAGIARRVEHVCQHAQELAGEKGSLHGYQCDLTKKDDILAAFKKINTELGPISILINNAGALKMSGIIEGDIEKWQAVVDTNLMAAAICIREAVASMKANSIKGHLININSMAGHIVPDYPKFGFYPSTKFGLRALTETVRLEINREKLPIKITNVSPGYVETDIVALAYGEFAKDETWSAITAKGLDVIDIANAVLYVVNTPERVNVTQLTVVRQGNFL
ncbi:farnesol dehydrogenase-like [Dendroctonus ponderosae]|uniref:Farnesol dehydrogenase-like n=1 Tax=Dendroctonus ponderosae TaxID=77166 RepID=J3JUS7_DENPD|nr:farnesol dehydrogenase-like [Dendroctonus ponderosae]AEE61954.1 unknown [Dendroctonus ponderosae]KAH1027498.1 hypothetical protein HUJ05_000993 [Dendroctonus ponderosae]